MRIFFILKNRNEDKKNENKDKIFSFILNVEDFFYKCFLGKIMLEWCALLGLEKYLHSIR